MSNKHLKKILISIRMKFKLWQKVLIIVLLIILCILSFFITGCKITGEAKGVVVKAKDKTGMSATQNIKMGAESELEVEETLVSENVSNQTKNKSFETQKSSSSLTQQYLNHRMEKERKETINREIRTYLFLFLSFGLGYWIVWLAYRYKTKKLKN